MVEVVAVPILVDADRRQVVQGARHGEVRQHVGVGIEVPSPFRSYGFCPAARQA